MLYTSYSPTHDSPDEARHKSLLLLTESALLFRLNALFYTYRECIPQIQSEKSKRIIIYNMASRRNDKSIGKLSI